MTSFLTVAVVTALCLAFSATRKYGVVGSGLLLYFQPYPTIGLLTLAGVVYFYLHRRNFV